MSIQAPEKLSEELERVVTADTHDNAKPKNPAGKIALYAVLIVSAAALLLPFFWMLMSSLKRDNDIFSVPIQWIPQVFEWSNYVNIWTQADMGIWLKNTM
ncbi:MAG: hypothetical protein LBR21_06620, partial [Propionibacteriaceae bacterium]|nr:hypothetical protein [Propionibacteriaceae bacterium]